MFYVRTIILGEKRVDSAVYKLEPDDPEMQQACSSFAAFMADRPPEFREKLPFLGNLEMEWTSAPGRVALASVYSPKGPCSMGILLAGVDAEADRLMLDAWRQNVVTPVLGGDAGLLGQPVERPILVNLLFPVAGELKPTLQMVSAALASVYFRCVRGVIDASA